MSLEYTEDTESNTMYFFFFYLKIVIVVIIVTIHYLVTGRMTWLARYWTV